MATEAQVVANRRNAQRSTGPRTAEGKAAVSQNAVKHGLSGRCDVIRGEDQEEFNQYREELFWELVPVGTMECRLAERIVSLAWRLRRAERIHNEAFDALLEKEASSGLSWLTGSLRSRGPGRSVDGAEPDLSPGTIAAKDFTHDRVLDRLLMYERRIESSLYRTMAELQKLRRAQELEPAGAARVSKASRLRIAGGTPATRPPADREFMTDSAKQSQSGRADAVGLASSRRDEQTPDGVTTNEGGSCETKPIEPAGSVPARASLETQDVVSLRGRGTSAANNAEQSQSTPVDGVHGTPYESAHASAGGEAPDGVTTSVAGTFDPCVARTL